jgi:hypothetical protein
MKSSVPTRGSCSKTFLTNPYRSKIEISALGCEAKSGMFQLSLNPSLFGVKNLGYLRTVVVKTVVLHVPFLSLIVMKCSPEVTLEKQGRLDTLLHQLVLIITYPKTVAVILIISAKNQILQYLQ